MPPLIFVVLCWIAGAFAGSAAPLAAVPLPWLLTVVAAAACVLGRCVNADSSRGRRDRGTQYVLPCTLMAVVLASVVHARVGVQQQQQCRLSVAEALNSGAFLRAVFDDHLRPRTSARGVVEGSGPWRDCRVPVSARTQDGKARPGEWVLLGGRATVTARGIRVVGTAHPVVGARRALWRSIRGRAGDVITRDFGENAPLVRALLIADQDGIDPVVRDTFADAGLVHLLSVSGLHVAIIAGSLLTLAGALRLSRSAAFATALLVIVAYVAVLGAPAPAVRSAIMLAVIGISERLQRPVHPWTALALGALIPAMQPAIVLDLGYQLSVSGMAALVAARAVLRRLRTASVPRGTPIIRTETYGLPSPAVRPPWRSRLRALSQARLRGLLRAVQRADGWRYTLLRECLTGMVATIVTAPLIAWTFGRVSVIAPLSNLVAGPLVGFAQPTLFLALLLSPWPTASRFVADASAIPLTLLDRVATLAAGISHASLHLAPTALGAACAGVAAAAFIWATGSRRWMPGLLTGALALTTAVWAPAFMRGSGELELHMLDVGQGDALALRTPKGRWILVDAGLQWDGGDSGRRVIVPYIRRLGGSVAAFVMSHAHDDHVGGAASVIDALGPQRWWEAAFVTRSAAYLHALQSVQQRHAAWHRVQPSDVWTLDGVQIKVLAPDSAWTAAQTDVNETSVVLRVQYGRVVFLLTGDAEAAEEAWIVSHTDPELLRADVLKLGHHGSKTSTTAPFLAAVQPRLGLASVGTGNRYGHPSPETLEALAARNVPVLRTDLEGHVVVATDGTSLRVRIGREVWTVPPR